MDIMTRRPTPERVTVPLVGGVCRRLFGPVDRDQLSADLGRQLDDMRERDRRRWNFSFETDQPLPGQYRWEAVPSDRRPASSDPGSAATCEEEDRNAQAIGRLEGEEDGEEDTEGRLVQTNMENCSGVSNTARSAGEVTPVRRKRAHAHAKAPQSNAHITGTPQTASVGEVTICSTKVTCLKDHY
ncbi:unnamed protein product [Merluccius merluccius]